MYTKRKADPRTVLGIVFIFISFGLAVNKPLPSHVLLIICNFYLWDVRAYRESVLYSGMYSIIAVSMFYIHYIPNSTIALMIVSLSYFIQKFVIRAEALIPRRLRRNKGY